MLKKIALVLLIITATLALLLPPDGQSISYENEFETIEEADVEQTSSTTLEFSDLDQEQQEAFSNAKSDSVSIVDGRVILSEGTTYVVKENSVEVYSVTTHSSVKGILGWAMIAFLIVTMMLYSIDGSKKEKDDLRQPDLTRASDESEWKFEVMGRNKD